MVSLTHHARKKSDDTLHLRIPDVAVADRVRSNEPFSLWKVGDLPILYHWLDHAVNEGYTRVLIYCSDRKLAIVQAMEKATLWPITWQVIEDAGESEHPGCEIAHTLPTYEASSEFKDEWALMDHWFKLERHWLEFTSKEDGDLSLTPNGVGRWCQIHPSAVIREPVWIGDRVRIGPDSEIGPYVSIGNGCVLNGRNRVSHSKVAENTFLGKNTELDQCYLEGGRLLNCKYRGTVDEVEPFIAGDLQKSSSRPAIKERWMAFRLWAHVVRKHGLRAIRNTPVSFVTHHDGTKVKRLASDDLLLERVLQISDVVLGRGFLIGIHPRTIEDLDRVDPRDRVSLAKGSVGAFSIADVRGVHSASDASESAIALEQLMSKPERVREECARYLRKLMGRSNGKA